MKRRPKLEIVRTTKLAGTTIRKRNVAVNSISVDAVVTTTISSMNQHAWHVAIDQCNPSPKHHVQMWTSRSAAISVSCHRKLDHADRFSHASIMMHAKVHANCSHTAAVAATRTISNPKTNAHRIVNMCKMHANCHQSKVIARAMKHGGTMIVAPMNAPNSDILAVVAIRTTSLRNANVKANVNVDNHINHKLKHQTSIR